MIIICRDVKFQSISRIVKQVHLNVFYQSAYCKQNENKRLLLLLLLLLLSEGSKNVAV